MPSAQGVLAPYGVCRSSLDFPPPDFCLLTPNLGDDISGQKPVRTWILRRVTSISPTPSFVDLNRRGRSGAPLRDLADYANRLRLAKRLAPTRRYFFAFLRRFAVLRAVFFAADFVFDFAFFAILPS